MSLLPQSIKDKNNLALEACMLEGLERIDINKILLCPLNCVKDEILNVLAKEYHITGFEGWNLAKTREQKEGLIDNSIILHSEKGAIKSVQRALKNLGIEAEIEEYFEYQGKPSHFRIKYLNLYDEGYSSELHAQIKELINCYKPATRKLDSINYLCCQRGVLFINLRIKTTIYSTIMTQGAIL